MYFYKQYLNKINLKFCFLQTFSFYRHWLLSDYICTVNSSVRHTIRCDKVMKKKKNQNAENKRNLTGILPTVTSFGYSKKLTKIPKWVIFCPGNKSMVSRIKILEHHDTTRNTAYVHSDKKNLNSCFLVKSY